MGVAILTIHGAIKSRIIKFLHKSADRKNPFYYFQARDCQEKHYYSDTKSSCAPQFRDID